MPGNRPGADVEPLLKAANEASQHVQNVYLTFLLLSTYIAVIIGSTTDEQLLKVSSVTLPLLNVSLPIVAFYTVIPWLFLLLHFNLLLQLYLLAYKLYGFESTIVDSGPEARWEQYTAKLFPFPFSHMLVGRYQRRFVRIVLAAVVGITILLLPLIILTWIQVRFLPYHNGVITCIQRVAVVTDLLLLWIFWPMIIGPAASRERIRRESPRCASKKTWIRYWHKMRTACRRLHTSKWSFFLVCMSLVFFFFSLAVAVLPGEENVWPFGSLTEFLFDRPGAYFHRNLRLAGKTLVERELLAEVDAGLRSPDAKIKEQAMRHVVGLNLANRDLRFADFRNARLLKVTQVAPY